MRQARYTDDGLEVVEVEPPPLPDDWVRLNVAACGICGTDLHVYRQHAWFGRGVCPGHEFAGSIAEGGAGLADALYAVDPSIHCRACEFCLGGMPQFCDSYRTIGIFVDGGAADSVVVPATRCTPSTHRCPTTSHRRPSRWPSACGESTSARSNPTAAPSSSAPGPSDWSPVCWPATGRAASPSPPATRTSAPAPRRSASKRWGKTRPRTGRRRTRPTWSTKRSAARRTPST